MASFHITTGINTTPQTLSGGQIGIIDAGAALKAATSGKTNIAAVTWTGGTVEIDNSGLLSASTTGTGNTRGIDSSSSLADGSSLTFNNFAGAALTSLTNDAIRVNADIVGGSVTVNNSGTIVSGSVDALGHISGTASGQALDFDNVHSATVTINNYVGGLIGAADADAIRPGAHATINNSGKIVALNGAGDSGNDGIDFQSNVGGGVVNNHTGGTIDGARHGITGEQQITVNNDGMITGHLGSGINMDTPSLSLTTVTNHGTIIGTGGYLAGVAVDGDGIDVDGLLTLDNFGTIQATGVHVVEANGTVDIQEAVTIGGGSITNEVGGVITSFERAITVNDSDGTGGPNGSNGNNNGNGFAPTTITNWGLIHGGQDGAISITDTFNDTITNHGRIEGNIVLTSGAGTPAGSNTITNDGAIDGSIAMGAGNDIVNVYTGSTVTGVIDGGDGFDTVNLQGAGTGTLGNFTHIEAVNLFSGDWSLGSEGVGSVNLETGAQSLRLSASTLADGHFDGTITGFGNDDLIDLNGIGTATSVSLGAGNVLTVSGASSGPITLQLDAGQGFDGFVFQVSTDGAGGTEVSLAKVISGGNGNSNLTGTAGNDVISGGNGNDSINSGDGNDSLSGGNGNDILVAGNGNDRLSGGNGDDTLTVGNGNNVLDGGNGNDIFHVGTGDNSLTGGNGGDTFIFSAGFGKDVITDFAHDDHMEFDGVFANFQAMQAVMQQVGANTVIGLDAGQSVTLLGVSMSSLHASNFVLH
jgi:hypothetical protein